MCFPHLSLLPCSAQCSGPIHPTQSGGTLFSFSMLSTSVDDPLSRSQELSHLPELTISPPRGRTPDWALRRFPGFDLSKTCSDFHGHSMARNVARPARDTLLTDSYLPYLSAQTKFLTWALSGLMSCYNYLISKAVKGCLPSSSVAHSLFLAILPAPTSDTPSSPLT